MRRRVVCSILFLQTSAPYSLVQVRVFCHCEWLVLLKADFTAMRIFSRRSFSVLLEVTMSHVYNTLQCKNFCKVQPQVAYSKCLFLRFELTTTSKTGTKQTLNGRPQRPTNKSPSKTPSKQHSIAVSSSFKRRHKAVAKFYIGGKNGVSL